MKKKTKLIYIKKSLFIFIVFVLFLGFATPALADYLGPDRTLTQATSVCNMVLTECMYVAAKDEYRYHVVEDWSCSNESKPWEAYENFYGDCESWNNGHTQWGKEEQVKTVTTTLPEATINSELQDCTMQNGWCVTAPQLLLTASEPLSSYQIIIVEGTRNSEAFACNGPTCTVQLNEGSNDFSYWALSTWGDSSQMGTTSAKVDTVPPDINLQISGSLGTGGWYTSNATLSVSAADATSGLATLEASEDNVIWNAYTAPLTFTDGVYTPVFRAADNAGNISNATTTISVDSITPSLVLSTSGSRGNNKWYLSNAKITAAASDATSGLKSIYASANGGPWTDASSLTFSNGIHPYRFRAVDNAGNVTETSEQVIMVDTIPPALAITEELNLGESFEYDLQDDGSGLYVVRVVIEDEDERFSKVTWEEKITGNKFKNEFVWDGKFKDGTSAPIGEYIITVKVSDIAGNETVGYGIVNVSPLSYFQSIPVFTLPTETPLTVEGSQSELDPQQTFGGDTASPTNPTNPSTQTLNVTGSVHGTTANTSSSNVLWGAMALSLIGTATALALEEKKKREEVEAKQIAQVKAGVEAFNEAQEANRIAMIAQMKIENWKHGQEVLNDLMDKAIKKGAGDEEIKALKETASTQGFGVAIADAQGLYQSLQQAGLAAYYNGMRQGEAEAAQQATLAEQQAGLMAYYEGMRQGEAEAAQIAALAEQQAGLEAYYNGMRQGELIAAGSEKSWLSSVPFVGTFLDTTWQDSSLKEVWNEKVYKPIIEPVIQSDAPKKIVTGLLTLSLVYNGMLWANNIVTDPHIFDDALKNAQSEWQQVLEIHPRTEENTSIQYLFTNPFEAFSIGYDSTKALANSAAGYLDAILQANPINEAVSNMFQNVGDHCPSGAGEEWVRRCSAVFYFVADVIQHPVDTVVGVGTALVAEPTAGLIKLAAYGYEYNNPVQFINDISQDGLVATIMDRISETGDLITDPSVQGFGILAIFTLATIFGLGIPALIVGGAMVLEQAASLLTQIDTALQAALTRAEAMNVVTDPKVRRQLATTIILLGLVILGSAKGLKEFTAFQDSIPPSAQTAFSDLSYWQQARMFESAGKLGTSPEALEFYLNEINRTGSPLADLPLADGLRLSMTLEMFGFDTATRFLIDCEKFGIDPITLLEKPLSSGQTLEGLYLGIRNLDNPVNFPLKFDQSLVEIAKLGMDNTHNLNSKLFSIGFFKNVNIPYTELAVINKDYPMSYFSASDTTWAKYESAQAFGDFWQVNKYSIEWGIEQRKIFVINIDYDTAMSYLNKSTTAEIKLIEMPANNYVRVAQGSYTIFAPIELMDSYQNYLPPELLIP